MVNMDAVIDAIQNDVIERAKNGRASDFIVSFEKYKSLPVTSPLKSNEVGFILTEVVLIEKVRTLEDGTQISLYDVYDMKGRKVLETQENGHMKFDREIMEDLIKDKVNVLEQEGYSFAGINSMDKNGTIESSFERINGKIIALNKDQKKRLDESLDRTLVMDDIDRTTANPELDASDESKNRSHDIKEQERKQSEQDDINNAKVAIQEDLGFNISEIEKVDDTIFKWNNPQTIGKDIYVALTDKNELKFLEKTENGGYKEVEGFERSSSASGRTTKIVNDDDMLYDNEVNTYGEIYPSNRDGVRYTIEKSRGSIKLIEQREYNGAKMSETDKWVSREVTTSNTDYIDVNREGAYNSNNITARTFNMSSSYKEASIDGGFSGKGGVRAVGDAVKNKPTNTNMESMAPDSNLRLEAAKKMVADVANKEGASLDPDTELAVNEHLKKIVEENEDKAFTEDMASEVLTQVFEEKAAEENGKDNKNALEKKEEYNDEKNAEQEDVNEGRSRLEEAYNRMRRGH